MADMAIEIQSAHPDLPDAIQAITADVVQMVPGVAAACLVTLDQGRLTCHAPTAPMAKSWVAIEETLSKGPCWDVLKSDHAGTLTMDDLATVGPSWTDYASVALAAGIAGVSAIPLKSDGKPYGALALFATRSGVFTDALLQGVDLYIAHASIALSHAQETTNLRAAVEGRDKIGQAKGILMERYKLNDRQAFALLVKASQKTNTPLRQVAEQLTLTGEVAG